MLGAVHTFSGFSVDNTEKAKQFYVETLGLTLKDDSMGLDIELPDGGRVFIYQKDDHQPATFTVLNFVVKNIDETIDDLAGLHGIVFERYDNLPAPQDEKGVLRGKAAQAGPDIAWFEDPAGNILAILQN